MIKKHESAANSNHKLGLAKKTRQIGYPQGLSTTKTGINLVPTEMRERLYLVNGAGDEVPTHEYLLNFY